MELVLSTIACGLGIEISNKFEVKDNEIIVFLSDGTKARIKAKIVA